MSEAKKIIAIEIEIIIEILIAFIVINVDVVFNAVVVEIIFALHLLDLVHGISVLINADFNELRGGEEVKVVGGGHHAYNLVVVLQGEDLLLSHGRNALTTFPENGEDENEMKS